MGEQSSQRFKRGAVQSSYVIALGAFYLGDITTDFFHSTCSSSWIFSILLWSIRLECRLSPLYSGLFSIQCVARKVLISNIHSSMKNNSTKILLDAIQSIESYRFRGLINFQNDSPFGDLWTSIYFQRFWKPFEVIFSVTRSDLTNVCLRLWICWASSLNTWSLKLPQGKKSQESR